MEPKRSIIRTRANLRTSAAVGQPDLGGDNSIWGHQVRSRARLTRGAHNDGSSGASAGTNGSHPRRMHDDPPPPSPSLIAYGNIVNIDVLDLVKLPAAKLKDIYDSAPDALKSASRPRGSALLHVILKMRDDLKRDASPGVTPSQDKDDLNKIIDMNTEDIEKMAQDDPSGLHSLLQHGLNADRTLSPRSLNNTDGYQLAFFAVSWKLQLEEETLEVVKQAQDEEEGNNSNPLLSYPKRRAIQFDGDVEEVEPTSAPETRLKITEIGGVRLGSRIDEASYTGFRSGLGGSTTLLPSQLPMYPGRAHWSELLRVQTIMGPSILYSLMCGGMNVETYVLNRQYWSRDTIFAAEMEAVTLGRIVHLNLLRYPSIKEAVESCPWMEVALRRLYCILKVEESFAQGRTIKKSALWNSVTPMLEAHLTQTLSVPALDILVTQQFASAVK